MKKIFYENVRIIIIFIMVLFLMSFFFYVFVFVCEMKYYYILYIEKENFNKFYMEIFELFIIYVNVI